MAKNILENLLRETEQKNIPLTCLVELTRRCNQKCCHCYITGPSGREMSTSEIKHILFQLSSAGCLFLTFSGGEPLLRNDLMELIWYARSLDFCVSLMSNGTLISGTVAAQMAESGVYEVGISLYGASEKIHDRVTGVRGSFKKTLSGINNLTANRVRVRLKCPLMSINAAEHEKLNKLSEKLGTKISFDPLIVPADDGNKRSVFLRLKENQLRKTLSGIAGKMKISSTGKRRQDDFLCPAGRNFCSVGPDGTFFACLQILRPVGNLTHRSFQSLWLHSPWLKKFRKLRFSDLLKCPECRIKDFCSRCPGVALLEDGNLLGPSSAACQIAHVYHSIK